jgi:hypothetical protein
MAQYGVSTQCAEPVMGSSGIDSFGAKKRDTKSHSLPGAVTMTPRRSSSRKSTATVYRLCDEGHLPHVRVLHAIRVTPADLEAFVRQKRMQLLMGRSSRPSKNSSLGNPRRPG